MEGTVGVRSKGQLVTLPPWPGGRVMSAYSQFAFSSSFGPELYTGEWCDPLLHWIFTSVNPARYFLIDTARGLTYW